MENENLIRELLHISKQINNKELKLMRLIENNIRQKYFINEVERLLNIVQGLLEIENKTISKPIYNEIILEYFSDETSLDSTIHYLKMLGGGQK